MDSEKRPTNQTITMFVILIMVAMVVAKELNVIAKKRESNYQFSGVVENIRFSDKDTPIAIINKQRYVLSNTGRKFKHKIEEGDSLIKEKNTRSYKLIKNKTGEVFYSETYR